MVTGVFVFLNPQQRFPCPPLFHVFASNSSGTEELGVTTALVLLSSWLAENITVSCYTLSTNIANSLIQPPSDNPLLYNLAHMLFSKTLCTSAVRWSVTNSDETEASACIEHRHVPEKSVKGLN